MSTRPTTAARGLHAIAAGDAPDRIREQYDADHRVRRAQFGRDLVEKTSAIFVTEALIGEPVGIAELDNPIVVPFAMPTSA